MKESDPQTERMIDGMLEYHLKYELEVLCDHIKHDEKTISVLRRGLERGYKTKAALESALFNIQKLNGGEKKRENEND